LFNYRIVKDTDDLPWPNNLNYNLEKYWK
jgi:hypothetical protein